MSVKNLIVAMGLTAGLFTSCKKEDVVKNVAAPAPTTPVVVQAKPLTDIALKDSTLFYSRDIYLWNKQIPGNFDPQTYADPEKIMTALRAYSTEGGSAPLDRWSFAMKKTEWDNISGGLNLAASTVSTKDFGIEVFFRTSNDLRVRHVERQSPAGLAGIRRGWRITKLNGSTNISSANGTTIINAIYKSENATLTFQKPDGTIADITLDAASYQEHPVVLDSVYSEGSKKIGYLVFNSFLGDTTQIYKDLAGVFSRFGQKQVTELIIDLRYNGGGYVNVQEKLANYIVNSSYNGQVMMTEKFNEKYSHYNVTKKFAKQGAVNVNRISFIVSSATASASELLINNLKPYMDVRLVGPSKTHGKPVGYFPHPLGEWYIFPVSFRTVNKNGEGNYFSGLSLTAQASDGIDKDWGDRNETALGVVLNGINTGSFRTSSTDNDVQMQSINNRLSDHDFKGAIDTRLMQ